MSCASRTWGSPSAAARTRSRRSSPRSGAPRAPPRRYRERLRTAASTSSAVWWLSTTACAGRDGHHGVGEEAAGRLTDAQPLQLHSGGDGTDRALGAILSLGRRAVHQHAGVLSDQADGRREDDAGHDQRRERVTRLPAGADEQQPDQHGERAGHVAREVVRVRAQRRRAVALRGARRHHHAAGVDHECDGDHHERGRVAAVRIASTGEPAHGLAHHHNSAGGEDGRLRQRGEVLDASVAVGVVVVGGPRAQPDCQKGEHGGDHIAGRLDAGGDQAQAAGDQAGAELERHQHGGRADREQGGALLGALVGGGRGQRFAPAVFTAPCDSLWS